MFLDFCFENQSCVAHSPHPSPGVMLLDKSHYHRPSGLPASPSAVPSGTQIQLFLDPFTWIPIYTQEEMYASHASNVSDWGDGMVWNILGYIDKLSYISLPTRSNSLFRQGFYWPHDPLLSFHHHLLL